MSNRSLVPSSSREEQLYRQSIGGCRTKRSMPFMMWVALIICLAKGSTGLASVGDQCRITGSRRVTCFPPRHDFSDCFCCTDDMLRQSSKSDDNCNKKAFNITSLRMHTNLEKIVFDDIKSITKNLHRIHLTFGRDSKTVFPFTFNNEKSLEKIYLEGKAIDTINNLSFVDLMNLISLNISDTLVKTIPIQMFNMYSNTFKYLNLSNNQIVTIQPQTFENENYIENLYLNNNNISCLSDDAFKGLGRLKILDLSHNRLENLTHCLFSPLFSIEEIRLDFNCITLLDNDTFAGLNNLLNLSLQSNFIVNIPMTLFSGTRNIKYLDLSDNQIELLNADIINFIANNFRAEDSSIQLDGNQLDCCHLDWVSDLMRTTYSSRVKNSLFNLSCYRYSPETAIVDKFNVNKINMKNHCLALAAHSSCPNCKIVDYDYEFENTKETLVNASFMLYRHYQNLNNCSEITQIGNTNISDLKINETTDEICVVSSGSLGNHTGLTCFTSLLFLFIVIE